MDQMEETARNGSREDAQAMLDQMQEMFENMRSAQEDQESPAEREMRKQIGELEKLLHDQQALRDDTFRSDQKDRARKRARRNQASPGQAGLAGATGPGWLEPPTKAITIPTRTTSRTRIRRKGPTAARRSAARTARPSRRVAAQAQEPRHEGREGFRRRARRHERGRRGPQRARQRGKTARVGRAARARALRSTRRVVRSKRCATAPKVCRSRWMVKARVRARARAGKGTYVGRRSRPGEMPGDDPLGRGAEGEKGREDGPLKQSAGAAERARRVMEELRRRLADPARPVDERDYLERLMKRD